MFTNAGHIDAKLIDFSEICQKNEKPSEIGCLLLIVCWRSFPPKFPVKSADFPKNLPLKILRKLTFFRKNPAKFFGEFWLFSRENLPKSADCSANFDFFSRENAAKSVDFSANLPLKIPRNFAFFFAKYQKPCRKFDFCSFNHWRLDFPQNRRSWNSCTITRKGWPSRAQKQVQQLFCSSKSEQNFAKQDSNASRASF